MRLGGRLWHGCRLGRRHRPARPMRPSAWQQAVPCSLGGRAPLWACMSQDRSRARAVPRDFRGLRRALVPRRYAPDSPSKITSARRRVPDVSLSHMAQAVRRINLTAGGADRSPASPPRRRARRRRAAPTGWSDCARCARSRRRRRSSPPWARCRPRGAACLHARGSTLLAHILLQIPVTYRV